MLGFLLRFARTEIPLSAARTLHSQIVSSQCSTIAMSKVVEGRSSREVDNVSSIQPVIPRSVE